MQLGVKVNIGNHALHPALICEPKTLVTVVRYIEAESDFQRLTRFLEVYVNEEEIG